MNEGDVILTPIPQADGNVKNRPAVILREMPLYSNSSAKFEYTLFGLRVSEM